MSNIKNCILLLKAIIIIIVLMPRKKAANLYIAISRIFQTTFFFSSVFFKVSKVKKSFRLNRFWIFHIYRLSQQVLVKISNLRNSVKKIRQIEKRLALHCYNVNKLWRVFSPFVKFEDFLLNCYWDTRYALKASSKFWNIRSQRGTFQPLFIQSWQEKNHLEILSCVTNEIWKIPLL